MHRSLELLRLQLQCFNNTGLKSQQSDAAFGPVWFKLPEATWFHFPFDYQPYSYGNFKKRPT